MIVVTGAAGFIGSCLISKLNSEGLNNIVAVDDFTKTEKANNLEAKNISLKVERSQFFEWLELHGNEVEFVFHIGARTDTTEFNSAIFDELNTGYTRKVWTLCSRFSIPLVYASSAATYGLGEFGYKDDHAIVEQLKPLNPYGESKNDFDKWALKQTETPPFWAGMKFFNVYGPNEYHKSRMASVIFHAYRQINETGKVKLFKSHRPDFGDGEQLRDFVYVKDVISVLTFMMKQKPASGLYNLGTGKARSFVDLAKATFNASGKASHIEFIDTPADIRDKYQYFTEANMQKLIDAGYKQAFTSLEDGVSDYVTNYLSKNAYL
ncbi:MAG: ADP-glyceromanno-heptose 6-epimerase [Lentimicrobiaceae bacterium]|nr:ADP-glyceromanno-heptose 6-epimerase [Lentimicrobiaceae bacterium]MCB9024098.1 ADP-glyceromanno-heptose 6-epimerase [Lentimicrobiaceae bacterium]MCO5264884.1 ADP-glyceromanno-heptose 6-epimerase [Lentimicrobium sp.]